MSTLATMLYASKEERRKVRARLAALKAERALYAQYLEGLSLTGCCLDAKPPKERGTQTVKLGKVPLRTHDK